MIKVGDNYYRNLEEQVLKNKEDIANHWNVDRVLADFGIKVLGKFDYVSDLDDPAKVDKSTLIYGDGYLIGLEAPYDVYVWTRANINAGEPDDYFLNIGKISIVGPQGPEGPAGEKGDIGDSTKWYASNLSPSNPGNYDLQDQWLNTTTGDVYEVNAYVSGQKYWRYTGNIRGPQGLQGIQGIQGERGPQGEPGPQGERGDVGGFINIWGVLTQSSQLPTPSSLNNMTVAYLVGTTMPYDLWIQVGESSASAIWQNTGPFNAATAVTSGGIYQNVWDADTKLDKYTNVTEYNQVYVKAANGGEGTINVTKSAIGDAVVQRNSSGSITLPGSTPLPQEAVNKQFCENTFVAKTDTTDAPTAGKVAKWGLDGKMYTNDPVNPTHCVNKQYAEANFIAKPSGTGAVYAAGDGTFSVRTIAGGEARPWSIVERTTDGVIYTGTPTADGHATTKAYVDNLLVQARFNFTSGSNYILINIYMKKSDYDTINSIETLAAYVNSKGAKSGSNTMILHMGEKGNNTAVTDVLQYIYAQNTTSFTIIGYARSSGAGTFINSSTLTYTSKSYVSL